MLYLALLAAIPILLFYGVYYLVLLIAVPILVLYSRRLGFAIIIVTVILMYRSRVRTATMKASRRVQDQEPPRRMTPWKDPWGTGKNR
jgi:hypothetical protein